MWKLTILQPAAPHTGGQQHLQLLDSEEHQSECGVTAHLQRLRVQNCMTLQTKPSAVIKGEEKPETDGTLELLMNTGRREGPHRQTLIWSTGRILLAAVLRKPLELHSAGQQPSRTD